MNWFKIEGFFFCRVELATNDEDVVKKMMGIGRRIEEGMR